MDNQSHDRPWKPHRPTPIGRRRRRTGLDPRSRDPDKALYAEFGVGSAPRSVFDPRAVAPTVVSVARQLVTGNRGNKPITNLHPTGGRLGLPADFLIGADGRVIACKYGTHANDQWSVDEVLAHAS